MRTIIFVLAYVATSRACSCFPQPAEAVFCEVDFASHVKVLCLTNPHNDNTGMHDVIYTVNHIHVFKKPPRVSTLPPVVFTPSSGATCGLYLQVGKEYLLS
ncbi:hypothetical protein TELCIR_23603, partial [Teladorsagia circumcincta]